MRCSRWRCRCLLFRHNLGIVDEKSSLLPRPYIDIHECRLGVTPFKLGIGDDGREELEPCHEERDLTRRGTKSSPARDDVVN